MRPFWLILRLLKRAHEAGLIGFTKVEIGLFVITVLTDDDASFEMAFTNIREFRAAYDALSGKVAKNRFADERFRAKADMLNLKVDTFGDYADSNGRYALMSGLLTLRSNKLAVAESRLPYINALLTEQSRFVDDDKEYLAAYYDPEKPILPTDNMVFLRHETVMLSQQLRELRGQITGIIPSEYESMPSPVLPAAPTIIQYQAYEQELRNQLKQFREVQFYREQRMKLAEIAELLEDIRDDNLVGGMAYVPAYFEWAVWRLFLALNNIEGAISETRGFQIDEDMQPRHHARGGAADLRFTYADFCLVCEMTLMSGSRQFASEGEPVTRHVYKVAKETSKPVYGLFVTNKLDPNTADAFHKARYWHKWHTSIQTPIVALTTSQLITLIHHIQAQTLTMADIRSLLDQILDLQDVFEDGPSWVDAYSELFEAWTRQNPG